MDGDLAGTRCAAGPCSTAAVVHWELVQAATKNQKERALLASVDAVLGEQTAMLRALREIDAALAATKAAFEELLVCRRAELMALVPLTARRASDLAADRARAAARCSELAAAAAAALPLLGVFVDVNRSSAEELEAAELATLAKGKRALADHEATLLAALRALLAGPQQQQQLQQQQPQPPQQQQRQEQQQQQQQHQIEEGQGLEWQQQEGANFSTCQAAAAARGGAGELSSPQRLRGVVAGSQ